MSQTVLETIFKAIDQVSKPLRQMEASTVSFASKVEGQMARVDRGIRKALPGLSDLGSQLKNLAIGGGIVGLTYLASTAILDYGKNVASFRTIVSELNDKEFSVYKDEVRLIALETKKSSVDVVQSFEKIAGLNAEFAKTAEGLGLVSKASITLAKASGDELGTSAENLVGIMNQFNKVASDADSVINVLAAGQAVGASSITQSAEAYKNFGAVASSANITLEQSQGLIQTLGQKSIFGSEAGNKLKGSILRLQAANLGYASGQFNVNDALIEAKKKMDSYGTAMQKDAFITKTFGAENLTAGLILLKNIDTYQKFTEGVTGTSEAQKAAAINSATLSNKIDELQNTFVTLVSTSMEGSMSMGLLGSVIGLLTNNLDILLFVVGSAIALFIAYKTVMLATQAVIWTVRAATFALNVVQGISNAIAGRSLIMSKANIATLYAHVAAKWLMSAATSAVTLATTAYATVQWIANAALLAFPVTWIVIAIAAIIAAVVALIVYWEDLTNWFTNSNSMIANIIRVAFIPLVTVVKAISTAVSFLIPYLVQLWEWISKIAQPLTDVVKEIGDFFGGEDLKVEPINVKKTIETTSGENIQKAMMNGNINMNVGLTGGLTGSVENSPSFITPNITKSR